MSQKIYHIENLDCANCAAKIEAKLNALPEVESAVITFATRQLRLTAENPDALLEKLTTVARTVEDGVVFHREGSAHHSEDCHNHDCCCHEHHDHHHHDHHHGHHHHHHDHAGQGLWQILVGAGLFVLGLVLGSLYIWRIPVSLPLFVIAYGILGFEVLATAGKNLVKGHIFDENFLMSIATLGAFAIGEFPEAVGVMLFYRVGEYFEHRAVERSRKQIMDAVDMRPEVVLRLNGDEVETIPAAEAKVGDLLLVRPGDRIPLDGTVISGNSRLNTAPVTGESVPVGVKEGDSVLSGCVNLHSQLTIRVEKPLEESMVTRILRSVENAAAGKPKIDRFITRFARIYTPVVVGAAALIAVVPSLITGAWNYWVYTALSFLVMSCPCALVLSVPLAFFSGIGVGSRRGILFKSGLSIETLASVKAVVMDKTGTLTKGDFTVQELLGEDEILSLCAGCERHSTHPIAMSIVAAAEGMELPKAEQVEELAGQGIRALVDGKEVLCGNEKLLARYNITPPHKEGTWVWVAREGTLLGGIRLGDTVKADATEAVSRLKKRGLACAMLTGDGETVAQAVGQQLGISEIHAQLLPEEKLTALQQLRRQYGPVMFVGDGINDAPVLSGADVGAAMGDGADAAMEAADVVFMTPRALAVPEALEIAAQTRRIATGNVIFALSIKLLVMVLGLLGYASMWAAVFADSGVAALCVAYAILPLYRKKYGKN